MTTDKGLNYQKHLFESCQVYCRLPQIPRSMLNRLATSVSQSVAAKRLILGTVVVVPKLNVHAFQPQISALTENRTWRPGSISNWRVSIGYAASFVSLASITSKFRAFNSVYRASISACFGFGIGARMNGLGMRPRSQVAVL